MNPAKRLLCIAFLALFVLGASAPAAAQSGATAAKDAVQAVTGGGDGQNRPTEYPYKDKKAPETLQGWVDYVLDFPLYKTGGEWIRLHELFLALLILIVGVWLSVLAGRIGKGWMIRFKRMPKHVAIAVSKGLVYLLVVFVVIATVLFAGMPFSIVSLLGAVVLLGASLGAKSTIYDYMSGLVLALEQPVRLGDCIEVSGHAGFVEEIRGRYTRVRRFDGIDVLVPNSMFLEDEVVNWTLHDSKLRGEIMVGVKYESDVDDTMDVLMSCMKERDDILESPEPSVLFWEFGESSLIFRLFFWLQVDNPLDKWSVESGLRRSVLNRLDESGIEVAFPQRDVHLDSRRPLKVEIDGGQERAAEDKPEKKARSTITGESPGKKREQEIAKPESDSEEGQQKDEDHEEGSA